MSVPRNDPRETITEGSRALARIIFPARPGKRERERGRECGEKEKRGTKAETRGEKGIAWSRDIKRGEGEGEGDCSMAGGRTRERLSARVPMRSGYPGIIFQVLPLYAEFPRKAIFEIFKIHIITAAKPALIIKQSPPSGESEG